MGEVCWGIRPDKDGRLIELVNDQNPGPEAPAISKRGGSKKDVKGGAMEKSRHVRVIERKKVRRDNPIEYFLHTGAQKYFLRPRGSDGSWSSPE